MPRPLPRVLLLGLVSALLVLQPSAAAASGEPDWWSYSRGATSSSIREAVRVPMRDGVRLACQRSRPARGGAALPGRFPSIVYEVTPYALLDPFFAEQGQYFASRGYVAITCTVRGSGASGGDYPQVNQPAEQTDAYDLVEWVAAQAWSDGRVGQTGESYGGMSSYRAAAARPPHLRAIAPQQAPNDLFLEDIAPGGVTAQPGLRHWWPLVGQLTSYGRISAARLFAVEARHPLRDAFWEQIAIDPVLDRIEVPVLAFAGWDDALFRSGAVRNVERLHALGGGDRTWLIAGPWAHGYTVDWRGCTVIPACVGAHRVPPGALLAWFDHWVAELPGAPLPSARVTSFQAGTGWRERDELDRTGAAPSTTLRLRTDGALAPAAGTAGTRAWRARPLDGVTGRVERITFRTEPFDASRALYGRPAVALVVEASASDANLHATLRLVTADGSSRVISEGWLRASQRRSHAVPELVRPGQPVTARWSLQPLDRVLPAGSHLALQLDSGSAVAVKPVPREVRVAVHTGEAGSALELPFEDLPDGALRRTRK